MNELKHHKFNRQLELESEMQAMGVARFREEVQKAKDAGLESTTNGAMKIMQNAFEPFCQAIDDWKKKCEEGLAQPGRPNEVWPIVKDFKTDVLAFMTMKTVMDNISNTQTLSGLTTTIATQIQNEINFRIFKKNSPSHYKAVKDNVSKRARKISHISRVVNRSAKKDNIELLSFSLTDKHKIGSLLLNLFINTTGLVEVYTPPQKAGTKKRANTVVYPTERTTEWLRENNARCELLSPIIMPMIVQPKDWTNPYDGGFWSEYVNATLVRRTSREYLEEIQNADMWEVYQAINHLQKTKWSVNTKVLDVLQHCVDNKITIGNLPSGEDIPKPCAPYDIEFNKESKWRWKKEVTNTYTKNVQRRSKFLSLQKKLHTAERFKDEEEIYFVYSLDFRGRVYPVQIHLNPQGDDISKSLLHFSEGKAIDDESGAWLAVHGANLFGYDKVALQDRVDWVLKNEENIRNSAKNPIQNLWWTEADKPWQFLAFCFEWSEFLENPETFVSHLSIALDGSCNGLQNFSAMLRDPIGGKATNLTPTHSPEDIYSEVAAAVERKIQNDADKGDIRAIKWKGYVNRELVKRPTMTMPYGATLSGYQNQILEVVQKWQNDGKPYPKLEDGGLKEATYLAQIIKESLGEIVVAAEKAMDWLQSTARVVAKENLPIYWVTPVGFPVMQNYRNSTTKQVRTEIGGKFFFVRISQDSLNKMDIRKTIAAISPNFVHSCDAAHLIRTVGFCETNDINSLHMVHDSYGTHAADTEKLRQLLAHAFVQIHKDEPLNAFYESMTKQVSDSSLIPPPPKKGELDIDLVLDAEFFFA